MEKFAPYIIDPMNKYKVAWDLLIGFIYLLSYMFDPVVLGFEFEPLESLWLYRFSSVVTYVIIVDIFIQPFTGVLKDDNAIVL